MATMAVVDARAESGGTGKALGKPAARASLDGCRLRALPNEDVCFWVKRIDNTKVVRASDPASRGAGWRILGGSVAAACLVIGLLVPNAYGVLAGYQKHQLDQERQRLESERVVLELEEARLLTSERLAELARIQELVDPAPEKVVYLNPKPDETLALNVGKR